KLRLTNILGWGKKLLKISFIINQPFWYSNSIISSILVDYDFPVLRASIDRTQKSLQTQRILRLNC
ncbi:hypothetical protein, partial [Hydrotalea sp.]|uniref:hypothetical protein n=1 Tax=Hydrotalea sp. TaxID=2881279 RepID=UPI002623F5C0